MLIESIRAALRQVPGTESVRLHYPENGEPLPALDTDEQAFEFPLTEIACGRLVAIVRSDSPGLLAALRLMIAGIIENFEAQAREQMLLEELSMDWEALEALYEITSDLRMLTDSEQILAKMLTRTVSVGKAFLGHASAAALWRPSEGWTPAPASEYTAVLRSAAPFFGWREMKRSRRTTLLWNGAGGGSIQDLPAPFGLAACLIAAPIWNARGHLEGALVLWSDRPGAQLDSRGVRLLEALALQASMIIGSDQLRRTMLENERIRSEIEIGGRIQQTLLFEHAPTDAEGLSVAAVSVASQSVGGDFYHFLQPDDGCLDVAVGDVMGKGVAAALMGAAAKLALLRAAGRFGVSSASADSKGLESMLDYVAELLTPEMIRSDRFVSLCYARIDPSRSELTYCDFGHTGILHAKRSGEIVTLRGSNMPMGFAKEDPAEQFHAALEPGDTLLFFSDGVTEARGPDGELFGQKGLAAALGECRTGSAKQCLDSVVRAVESFTTVGTFSDDFTLIAVVILGPEADHSPQSSCLDLPPDLRRLQEAREWLGLFCRGSGAAELHQDDIEALQLALTEAVTNVIRHALLRREGEAVRLEATRHSDRVQVSILHPGLPFEPTAVPEPSFDGSRDGGFGIFIMRQCVDELKYATLPDGRQSVELIKFFRQKEN